MHFAKILKTTLIAVAGCCTPVMADVSVNWQTTTDQLSLEVLQRSNVISDFTQLIDLSLIHI